MYEWDRLQNLNAISIILSALGVQDRGQMDLGSVGPKFTWRGQENRDYGRVSERLDRGFVNQALRLKFPDLSIKVLSGLKSDHHLLLAELVPKDRNLQRPQRPFRFEAAWISRTNFSQNGTSKYSAIFSRERRRCQHDRAVFKRHCTYNYILSQEHKIWYQKSQCQRISFEIEIQLVFIRKLLSEIRRTGLGA